MNNNDIDQTWSLCKDIMIPSLLDNDTIRAVMVYKSILVCLGKHEWGSKVKIWCFDVLDNKWYKSGKVSYEINKSRMISTGGRYCYYYNHDSNPAFLGYIDLYDAFPEELKRKIQERMSVKNMRSSLGYCRKKEMNLNLIVPDYLKRIVFRYYNDLP